VSDPRKDFNNIGRFYVEKLAQPDLPHLDDFHPIRKAKRMSDKVTLVKIKIAETSKRLWRDLLHLGLIVALIILALGACGAIEFFTCYWGDDKWVKPSECNPLERHRRK